MNSGAECACAARDLCCTSGFGHTIAAPHLLMYLVYALLQQAAKQDHPGLWTKPYCWALCCSHLTACWSGHRQTSVTGAAAGNIPGSCSKSRRHPHSQNSSSQYDGLCKVMLIANILLTAVPVYIQLLWGIKAHQHPLAASTTTQLAVTVASAGPRLHVKLHATL